MRFLFILLILFVASDSYAENICGFVHISKESNDGIIINFKGMHRIKVNHNVNGWAVSKSGKWFVVYGLPIHIERQFPQTTYLSVYKNIKEPKIMKTQSFGGGIFEVKFDNKEKNIFVSEQRGIYKMNTNTLKIKNIGINVDLESEIYSGACN
ncbi:hypothetical protein [Paraherbaspirillum soli]|uniref:Uncharacterized protein n=1 Tax=Paraherbaspirillum soli TaxID=631222 RepID=A0ABW0MA12_9BURK